jgi:hypothetical protein
MNELWLCLVAITVMACGAKTTSYGTPVADDPHQEDSAELAAAGVTDDAEEDRLDPASVGSCPGMQPRAGSSCVSSAGCMYQLGNGCLCVPGFPSFAPCQRVDPAACGGVGQNEGEVANDPYTSNFENCACVDGAWQCTNHG